MVDPILVDDLVVSIPESGLEIDDQAEVMQDIESANLEQKPREATGHSCGRVEDLQPSQAFYRFACVMRRQRTPKANSQRHPHSRPWRSHSKNSNHHCRFLQIC